MMQSYMLLKGLVYQLYSYFCHPFFFCRKEASLSMIVLVIVSMYYLNRLSPMCVYKFYWHSASIRYLQTILYCKYTVMP